MAQKVEYTSFGGRLMDSIKGILVGIIFFVASFVVLFWNEGRSVRTAKGLEEGQKACVEAAIDRLDPATDGKLVHLTGRAETAAILADPSFGISINALKLERTAKMFQWIERERTKTEKQMGGGEKKVTTYTYEKAWDTTWHDSSAFYEKQTPANPRMPVTSSSWVADGVNVGVYTLPRAMVQALRANEDLHVSDEQATSPGNQYRVMNGLYYLGADAADPQIGDMQVSYRVLTPSDVSLLARRNGSTFEPYVTAQNTTISVIKSGSLSAAVLFQQEISANRLLTWILRLAGFLAMALGLGLIFRPLATVGDVIPIVGSILGTGIAAVAFLVSLILTFATIGVAWLAYRPVLGGTLLAAAAGVLVLGMLRRKKVRREPVAAAA